MAETGYYLLDNPPARSQYRAKRRATPTGCIVAHTAEAELRPGAARGVARFIQHRSTPGSYHAIADETEIVDLLPYSHEAYQDGTGSNRWAIGISLAMRASDWPRLAPDRRQRMVEQMATMASHAAAWLELAHGIVVPPVRLTRDESDRGLPGFIAHGDRDPGRRSDPGAGFPWPEFLNTYATLTNKEDAMSSPWADLGPAIYAIRQLYRHHRGPAVSLNAQAAVEASIQEWVADLTAKAGRGEPLGPTIEYIDHALRNEAG